MAKSKRLKLKYEPEWIVEPDVSELARRPLVQVQVGSAFQESLLFTASEAERVGRALIAAASAARAMSKAKG